MKTSPFYRIYFCLIPEISKSAKADGSDLAERLGELSGTRHLRVNPKPVKKFLLVSS